MDFNEKIDWFLRLERLDICDICDQKLEENVEQEVGYHTTCLQLRSAEVQRLLLLKEKIIESSTELVPGSSINLLTYVIEDQAIVEINTIYFDEFLLETIPEMITTFPGLKTLAIGEIKLPAFLQDMDQLEELVLLDSDLDNNIDVLRKIKTLKKLHLPFNYLESFPEELFELTNLTELDVSHNDFFDIPESISKLVNLEKLDVSNIRLTTIPESISKLTNLKYLNLSPPQDYNRHRFHVFQTIPESLGNLEKLEVLIITYNVELTSIPESISKLQNLRILNLSHNNLTRLPDTLDQLLNLEEVNLVGNKFEEVPKFLFKLHKTGKLKRVFLKEEEIFNDEPSPFFTHSLYN